MTQLLKKIKGNTYYLKGPVNAGVYVYEGNSCVVVDTGIDDDAGRKLLKAVDAMGLEISAIINTHSHADHFGGNEIIIKRTGAEVMTKKIEAAIITNPYLEPFYLFSAHPLKTLQNKFLMGKESRVDRYIETGEYELGSVKINIIDLKGHSPAQIGVATPDGVLFTADAYFSSKIIKKYRLPYFTNINDTIQTLKMLKEMEYAYYLPCHGKCVEDIRDEIKVNLDAIYETIDFIHKKLVKPMSREEIVASICKEYGIKLNINQYYLTHSCVSAFLSYMTDEGMLKTLTENYQLKWVVAKG